MSRTRSVTGKGAEPTARACLAPETAAREANSGREPKAVKVEQVLVPVRQAVMAAVWPSVSGPTVSVAEAIPFALVVAGLDGATMPVAPCQVTFWPAEGEPPLWTSAWTGHWTVAPAARWSVGASEVRAAGVPA
jgi:hypothetical protein